MTTHELKTWPEFFRAIGEGFKRFEVRRNDRDFQVGDMLVLREWDPETREYTGNVLTAHVSYLLDGTRDVKAIGYGVREGYVVLSLAAVRMEPPMPDTITSLRAQLADLEGG